MPTKKKGKKGSKKKEKLEAKGDAQPEVSVLDKHYYLSQIQSLERNVERITQRCDQLSNAEGHARERYRTLHQEKNDIVYFLKERLKSKEDEIEELRSRLLGLVKASQTDKEEYENRLTVLRQDLDHTKADLSDQILSLTRKLDSLEEFRLQKEKIDAEHIALNQLLESEREEHKDKIASLERSSIEERKALDEEHKEKLVVLTEELREAARKEIHATTKSALVESGAQFRSISSMKSKVLKLRRENAELRNNLKEQLSREAVLQDSLEQMTSISERRALALRKVVQRAMEHSDVRKDYDKLLEEKETIKRDLQQTQVQLDAATRISCDIRENSSEKMVALELLSAKLQEERHEKKTMTEILHSALQILQENIFSKTEIANGTEMETKDILNVTLKHLVDILSEAEQSVSIPEDGEHRESTLAEVNERKDIKGEPLATYTAGDLGLVPRNTIGKK